MRTYLVVIPAIVESVTDRCVETLDIPTDNVLVVDNSPSGFAAKYHARGIQVRSYPENLGVGRSWNIGLREDRDITWLVSASLIFNMGFSQVVRLQEYHANTFGLLTNQAWHLVGIGREMVKRVGFFDENFYPAYFEDTDFMRRAHIQKLHPHRAGCEFMLPKIEVNASCQTDAHAMKSGVKVNYGACADYYRRKWGGETHQEVYETPFGMNVPIDYWEPNSVEVLRQRYGI